MPAQKSPISTLLVSAFAYFVLDAANRTLFSSSPGASGTPWIYLPSGLQLVFVLVFLNLGVFSIVLASCAIGLVHHAGMDTTTVLGAGLISGLAPWLARLICLDAFKLDTELQHLKASDLVKMAASFAALEAVLQQMWLSGRDPSVDFLGATAAMFASHLLGTLVLLYVAKYLINLIPAPGPLK